MNSIRGLRQVQTERMRNLVFNGLLGLGAIEPESPADEPLRVDVTQHQIRIGNGRQRPALVITGGPRRGSRAARPNAQSSAGIKPGEAPAASSNLSDIDRRHADEMPASLDQAAD